MFTYLHGYHPETWEAQVRAGLINRTAGIRFSESIEIDEYLKFNNLAREGGALYETVREMRCPFYIDRLQGGCYIENYEYDQALVNRYRELLGDNFWGFQMHEWMSNYRNDIRKLERGGCPAWTVEDIVKTIRKEYDFPYLFLEAMTAEEMFEAGKPETISAFLKVSEALFARRQRYTDGDLLPCDSYFLSYPMELKHGAKRLMPEIGAQTPDTRIQIAYARGMTKAYRKPFGVYYEPWGGDPFSACCYQRDGRNEWNIHGENFPFQTCGGNGGSSRSLQRRMQLYAYMAGASFISEEWGTCNTFYDWHDFELSPYGQIKLDFIRFTEKYPDIGRLLTPVAVVLPAELPVLEGVRTGFDRYCDYPVDASTQNLLRTVKEGLRKLFVESDPMLGTETASLVNGTVTDALDIVNEDCLRADEYEYLVDLTGGRLSLPNRDRIITPDEVPAVLDRLLPVTFDGAAQKMVTRAKDGTYYLMLLNNSGVVRTVAGGESLLREADSTVTVTIKGGRQLRLLDGDSRVEKREDGRYAVTVPAGGWFFGSF